MRDVGNEVAPRPLHARNLRAVTQHADRTPIPTRSARCLLEAEVIFSVRSLSNKPFSWAPKPFLDAVCAVHSQ
jgi:hypothetical protein